MDRNLFDQLNRQFEDALKKVRDCVNSEGFKTYATIMGMRLMNAEKNGKGRVSLEYDAPRCLLDVSGNEALLIIAMQQLIQHFGVDKALGLIAANCFAASKTVNVFSKNFETYEEKEVFIKVMNMSEEEREKIKNEL